MQARPDAGCQFCSFTAHQSSRPDTPFCAGTHRQPLANRAVKVATAPKHMLHAARRLLLRFSLCGPARHKQQRQQRALCLLSVLSTAAVYCHCPQLMRGAGCTINDLWDRDIDRQVKRTRSRPLAAGTVTPLAALVFLGAQLSLGLAILLQLNTYTQVGCTTAQQTLYKHHSSTMHRRLSTLNPVPQLCPLLRSHAPLSGSRSTAAPWYLCPACTCQQTRSPFPAIPGSAVRLTA